MVIREDLKAATQVPKGGTKGGASPDKKKTPLNTSSPLLARPRNAEGTRIMRGRTT